MVVTLWRSEADAATFGSATAGHELWRTFGEHIEPDSPSRRATTRWTDVELADLKVTRYEVRDAVATVTLHRPERLNAWTGRMHTEYRSLLARASRRPFGPGHRGDRIRARLLRRGRHAGRSRATWRGAAMTPGSATRWPGPVTGWPEFDADFAYHFGIPKPIIAAVNGPAAGVGLVLACYCDLRFAAAGVKLTSHGRLGLPAEYGLSWLLPRLIGLTRAADLLLEPGRAGRGGGAMGLVNRASAPRGAHGHHYELRRALAREIAPSSLAATKEQLYGDLHGDVASAVGTPADRMVDMMRDPTSPHSGADREERADLRRPESLRASWCSQTCSDPTSSS